MAVAKKKKVKVKIKKKAIKKKLVKGGKKKVVKKKVLKKKIVTKKVSRRGKSVAKKPLKLQRAFRNPVISPEPHSYWESEAVFNPGAVIHDGRVHLFYRALGADGVSRVGYASSKDGVHFDKRYPHPVYMPEDVERSITKHQARTSPARLVYDRALYPSGGGW